MLGDQPRETDGVPEADHLLERLVEEGDAAQLTDLRVPVPRHCEYCSKNFQVLLKNLF